MICEEIFEDMRFDEDKMCSFEFSQYFRQERNIWVKTASSYFDCNEAFSFQILAVEYFDNCQIPWDTWNSNPEIKNDAWLIIACVRERDENKDVLKIIEKWVDRHEFINRWTKQKEQND
jgi:hypothetical protein